MAKRKLLNDTLHTVFCTQCAMIYENGLPIEEGLILLSEQTSDIDYLSLLERYRKDNRLVQTLKDSGQFDQLLISSLELAVQIGKEESILKHLSQFYQHKVRIRQSIKDLLTMPFILFSLLIIVLNVLSLVILPIFQTIFINLGGTYPAWMSILLVGLNIVSTLGIISLFVFIVWALYVSVQKLNHPEKSDVIDRILSFIPKSVYKSDLAYFSYLVEIMVESGVNNETAFNLVFDYLPKRDLYKTLKSIKLSENESIIDLILKANIYPSFTQNTIRLAYKSGNLENTLRNVSDMSQRESDQVLDKALSRIEPIVLMILAVGVGSVLLSLVVPLLQAMSTLGF